MSKITIVNRKFLEEQVKLMLQEIGMQDVGPGSAVNQEDGDYVGRLLDIGPSILKDILETPVWLSTIGDRALFSGGSRSRQALFKSDAPDDIKYFFNIYEVDREEKLRLSDINRENFIVSRDLLKVLDRVSGLSDLKDIYEELKDFYSDGFFGAGDISRMVLVSENSADQIIAVAKKKNIEKKQVIKLFFKGFFNKQYEKDMHLDEILYPDYSISEYFDQSQDNILEQLNEKYKDDLGAFVLYSSMDPAMTKSLEEWKETYRQVKEIEKANESKRPMNFTTLLLLVVGEGKLENKIENSFKNASRELAKEVPKKAVRRFFGGLFKGLLYAVATILVNEAVDAAESTWGPSRFERLKIKESIEGAKRLAIKIAKEKEYKFTSDDMESIRKILMTPLKIITEEFNQSIERSALTMTSKELANTFVNFQNSMEGLRKKVFNTQFDINNKEDYDNFIKSLDEHYKAFIEEYNKVRMPAKLFENQNKLTRLQLAQREAKAKFYQMQANDKLDPKYMKPTGMIEFIADEISKLPGLQGLPIPGKSAPDEEATSAGDIKIRGILISKDELAKSGLTKEFILQLMTWYDLEGKDTRDVRFEAINEVAMQLKIFIKKQKPGSAVLGKYNRQFTKKWRAFGRPLQSAFKTTQPAFVRKEYSGVGLLSEFISLGRLFKNNQRYTMVCAPMVWWLEDNSCLAIDKTSNTELIFQDLAGRSSVLNKGGRFDKFSEVVLDNSANYQKLKDTYNASVNAYKKVESFPGNLRVILQTNIAVCGALIELEEELVKAENNAEKRFPQIDASVQNSSGNTTAGSLGKDQKAARIAAVKAVRDEVGMIYAYVELYNRVEKLFLDNNIRFF